MSEEEQDVLQKEKPRLREESGLLVLGRHLDIRELPLSEGVPSHGL